MLHSIFGCCCYYSTPKTSTNNNQVQFPQNIRNSIALLNDSSRMKIFGDSHSSPVDPSLVNLSNEHLKQCGLDVLQKGNEPDYSELQETINKIEWPELLGLDIEKHFIRMASSNIKTVSEILINFSNSKIPIKPKRWNLEVTGCWTKYYTDGKAELVDGIKDEDIVILDVETLKALNMEPVLAVACSKNHWYSWCSKKLSDSNNCTIIKNEKGNQNLNQDYIDKELIKINNNRELIIIAHFASFDRSKIYEEYQIFDTNKPKMHFIDTMSLHCAVKGFSSEQRLSFIRFKQQMQSKYKPNNHNKHYQLDINNNICYELGSLNSLKETAKLYCNIDIDKGKRDIFVNGNIEDIRNNYKELIEYCANDVNATFEVYRKVYPMYMRKCPSLVTLNGILTMGKSILPMSKGWNNYIKMCEAIYQQRVKSVEYKLQLLAKEALEYRDKYEEDPWLRTLDWKTEPLKMTKPKVRKDGSYAKNGMPRPYKNQLLPNKPKWYRDIYDPKSKKVKITVRSRLAPILMRLKYRGYPIYYSRNYGWTYAVPRTLALDNNNNRGRNKKLVFLSEESCHKKHLFYEEIPHNDTKNYYYKIPHSEGEDHNCGNLFAKEYLTAFTNNIITSDYELAKEAIEQNISCSYWISLRERVNSQFVVNKDNQNLLIPKVAVMGTVTRRAVEPTWLTASNSKSNKIGSELKSLIQTPKGYCIVGADVDSQELWIASLLSDAMFGFHGSTAIGWMTLCGTKRNQTDMHSKTAQILNITRDDAKIFNYSRIYGAGVAFAKKMLRQNNPQSSEEKINKEADKLYKKTKGTLVYLNNNQFPKKMYCGGSESYMFNILEKIANSEAPKTPVLGCEIPDTLKPKYIKEMYLTSRINWVVQSSGVDYLHLLITAMDYLTRRYKIEAQYMISIHDEIRYLVKEKDRLRAALALQIANAWTRALFSYKLNINNLPLSVVFFSEVDIDFIMRKDVNMECVTPSQPNKIKPGVSYNIEKLINETNSLELKNNSNSNKPKDILNLDAKNESSLICSSNKNASYFELENRNSPRHICYLKMQACQNQGLVFKELNLYENKIKKNNKHGEKRKSKTNKSLFEVVKLHSINKPKKHIKNKNYNRKGSRHNNKGNMSSLLETIVGLSNKEFININNDTLIDNSSK